MKRLPEGLAVADGIRQALKLLAKAYRAACRRRARDSCPSSFPAGDVPARHQPVAALPRRRHPRHASFPATSVRSTCAQTRPAQPQLLRHAFRRLDVRDDRPFLRADDVAQPGPDYVVWDKAAPSLSSGRPRRRVRALPPVQRPRSRAPARRPRTARSHEPTFRCASSMPTARSSPRSRRRCTSGAGSRAARSRRAPPTTRAATRARIRPWPSRPTTSVA